MDGIYYNENLWNVILQYGSAYCHWGGTDISKTILSHLKINNNDIVCDFCCGEAGTYDFINRYNAKFFGVDSDKIALEKARNRLSNSGNIEFVCADVRNLPFKDEFFTKAFSQDPDVFLYPNKVESLKEISRTIQRDGTYILQTYGVTSSLSKSEKCEMDNILNSLGYDFTSMINVDSFQTLVDASGFQLVDMFDLHDSYQNDNELMIRNMEKNWGKMIKLDRVQAGRIQHLMYFEQELFAKKSFTGSLFVLKKK